MALIQPCRGAPPEPLGDGTQASFQPSLKNVEQGSGRQALGSGLPQSDSVEEGLHEFGAGNQGYRYRFEATCCLMRSPSKAKEPDAQPNDQRTKP